jgi:succinylarginine dihydrolase
MSAFEVNFDGIVGPTHNYGGLSHGNVASMTHEGKVSNPRLAALEGMQKMRFVH